MPLALLLVVPVHGQEYYVRAHVDDSYIIEHDGRKLTATCRETLSWLDGTEKLGRPMAEHECTYMGSLVGQRIRPEMMWQQGRELRYRPWVGQATSQTADILDITDDVPVGSGGRAPSPKTSPEILKALHWIQNTLEDNEGTTHYFDKGVNGDTRINLLPDMNGCAVTFVYAIRSREETTLHSRSQLNLGDLDPTSLDVYAAAHDAFGPVSIVTVYTTDKAPAVRLTVNDRSWPGEPTLPSTDLLWELPASYADRFAKALKQAVTLCGGKPSSF